MKGQRTALSESVCGIGRSLDVIGDWWSLMILRDAFAGLTRFGEFQKSLGLAKNILSVRLTKLVADGILATEPAAEGSAYKRYVLTPKGESLHTVIVALWQWGEAHAFGDGAPLRRMVDRRDGLPVGDLELRAADGRVLGPRDTKLVLREQG